MFPILKTLIISEQEITGKKVITSDLTTVFGDLVTNSINTKDHPNVDFSDKYDAALKINEDATIAGPNFNFKKKTTLLKENISGDLPDAYDDVLPSLISLISNFMKNLYNFYNDEIVKVIPKLDKETTIANKLDLGKLGYLEETKAEWNVGSV